MTNDYEPIAGHRPPFVHQLSPGVWRLRVRVQPGARKSEPAGVYGATDEVRARIKLAAPPVDGKANKALTAFVAGRLALKTRQVSLDAGLTSRDKSLIITADNEPEWERIVVP